MDNDSIRRKILLSLLEWVQSDLLRLIPDSEVRAAPQNSVIGAIPVDVQIPPNDPIAQLGSALRGLPHNSSQWSKNKEEKAFKSLLTFVESLAKE